MDARITLAAVLHLSEVGTIEADEAHRRVLHVDLVGDLLETCALGAKGEDALDNWCLLVGHEFAVHHVVTGGCVVLPASILGGLALSHLRVLHDLIAVVLGEDSVDPDLHLA